jgi:hypothetical protein
MTTRTLGRRLARVAARLAPEALTVVVEVPHSMEAEAALARLGVSPAAYDRLVIVTDFAGREPRLVAAVAEDRRP